MKSIEKIFDDIEKNIKAPGSLPWQHRWTMLKTKIKQIFSTNVHVICCNDRVVAVVIGSEETARQKCTEMKDKYMKKNYSHLTGHALEQENKILYYHLHTVNVFFLVD